MSRKHGTQGRGTAGAGGAGRGHAGKRHASGSRAPHASRGRARPPSGKRRAGTTWILLAVGVVLVLGSVRALSGGAGPDAGLPREGSAAPSLKAKTLDGDRVSLTELRGKVVLVNFWATWCPPCRAEMPGFERVWPEKQKDGFVVLGLSADEGGPGPVASFLEDRGISYPVAMASAGAKRAFGGVSALPASFLIDRNGVVRRTVTGLFDERLLRQDVSRLLAE